MWREGKEGAAVGEDMVEAEPGAQGYDQVSEPREHH